MRSTSEARRAAAGDRRRLEEGLLGIGGGPERDKQTGLELTHPDTTSLIVEMALAGGFRPRSVLDPAAGYGNFLYEAAAQDDAIERLVGFETDAQIAAAARARLWEFANRGVSVEILTADALLADMPTSDFDLVLCNPPYVRIHRLLDQKAELRKRFDTATGRFDLYFLFFELATRALRPGGRLAMITSNKFMTTNAGAALRGHLRSNYVPLRILDFKDASPFKAAILASVLVLEKAKGHRPVMARFIELERVRDGSASELRHLARDPVPDYVEVRRLGAESVIARTESKAIRDWSRDAKSWHFASSGSTGTFEMLSENSGNMAKIFRKFSVGIKSTADDVFISPFDEEAARSGIVERDLLHPLIRGKSVGRWATHWDPGNGYDRYVLYPHREGERGRTIAVDLDQYPLARAFLGRHQSRLASREYVIAGGRAWYELWVPQRVQTMTSPRKLVFPDFATNNTFALDFSGAFVGSSAAFGVPISAIDDEDLWYVLYLVNSPLYEYLHKRHFGTSILAKRYRYWTRHVAAYPLPWPASATRRALANEARQASSTLIEPSDYLGTALAAFFLDSSQRRAAELEVTEWLDRRVAVGE
jgi:adenine-specific DNA-methyltransferase